MKNASLSAVATVVATLLAVLLAPRPALADEILTVDGVVEEGVSSIEVDDEGAATVVTESGKRIPLADVQLIRLAPLDNYYAASGAVRIALRNGDVINAEVTGGDEDGIKVESRPLGERSVPLELVHGVLFPPASRDRARVRVFEQTHLAIEEEHDVCFLTTGGRAEGTVEQIDHEGVVIQEKTLDSSLNLEPDQIESVVLLELDPLEPTGGVVRVRARLSDGSLLTGVVTKLAEGQLEIESLLDEEKPIAIPVKEVSSLTVIGGRTTYLADLPGTARQAFGEFDEADPIFPWDNRFGWKRDRTCLGAPIRLEGKLHERGIGVHCRSELTFKLEPGDGHQELRALVALDDSAREPSDVKPTVTFQVIVDGKPRLGEGLLVGASDEPRLVKVDVKGAKEVILLVDQGESLHERGRAVWANAHLVKGQQ